MGSQAGRKRLESFIESEGDSMAKTLRYYVLRAGLASGSEIARMTDDLFNDMVVEALRTADRLKPDVHPKPWLLGIAANLIKRRQSEMAKRDRREPLMRDLYPDLEDTLSDDELFDLLPVTSHSRIEDVEADETITQLLSGLSKSDADLLRRAILHDMSGEALAKELGVSPVAARVRLHRAIQRLRTAQTAQEGNHHDH
jgi:RNA polymerase sigma-70 factor (ECF subfamily)